MKPCLHANDDLVVLFSSVTRYEVTSEGNIFEDTVLDDELLEIYCKECDTHDLQHEGFSLGELGKMIRPDEKG